MNNKLIEELYNKIDNQEKIIRDLQQELNQKNKIIEELEKYIKEYSYYSSEKDYKIIDTHDLLEKIEELEKGSEDNE